MALYHMKAEKLKPLVAQAGFSVEQLNLVLRMMEGCSQLRQRAVIDNFLGLMLPEGMEMVKGDVVHGEYGPFQPMKIVAKKAEVVAQ